MAGHVVIEIKAFGINHAEMHMRRGEWAEAAKVIRIECVGLVKSCPGGEFPVGAKVAALMGGLGRTINGSYAEYTRVRASNGAPIGFDLPWAELAAIPETYATAWTCLFRNLEIVRGQTLVIRGAASSFGQAALNMAIDAGVRVIATSAAVSASPCWSNSAQSASKRRGRSFRRGSLKPRSSMRCSTLSATGPWVTRNASLQCAIRSAASRRRSLAWRQRGHPMTTITKKDRAQIYCSRDRRLPRSGPRRDPGRSRRATLPSAPPLSWSVPIRPPLGLVGSSRLLREAFNPVPSFADRTGGYTLRAEWRPSRGRRAPARAPQPLPSGS